MSIRKGSTQFENFLDPEDLAGAEVIDVRISDNVLEEDDWTIDRFAVINGRLQHLRTVHKGIYNTARHTLEGKTLEELAQWSQWNPVGHHPETYYEARVFEPLRPEVSHARCA